MVEWFSLDLLVLFAWLSRCWLPLTWPRRTNRSSSSRPAWATSRSSSIQDKAPKSVENFLGYVNDGFYDGTIFHRVIPTFMIQGGGFTPGMEKKPTRAPIQNEADNGLKNRRGTLAMARTGEIHSATGQFFINVKDNSFLDYKGDSAQDYGYAVFARVTEGMDVVDKIKDVKTGSMGPFPRRPDGDRSHQDDPSTDGGVESRRRTSHVLSPSVAGMSYAPSSMPRVLLLLPTNTYRAHDFMAAAGRARSGCDRCFRASQHDGEHAT